MRRTDEGAFVLSILSWRASAICLRSLAGGIGGEPALGAVVKTLAAATASDSEVARIRRRSLFDSAALKHKPLAFSSGFAGGPPSTLRAAVHAHGPPAVRRRPGPDMGLERARRAQTIADPEARAAFGGKLATFTDFMRDMAPGERAGPANPGAGQPK